MATHLTFYLFTLAVVAFLFAAHTYRYLEIYELLGGKGKNKTKYKRTSERLNESKQKHEFME